MNLFRIFGIGADAVLAKDHSVPGVVTSVRNSALYVIKKPVRLYNNESNTRFSHFITFRYVVDGVEYQGKLFLTPFVHCPQKGEQIEVYYDPEKPENYACYNFGPATFSAGW